MRELRYLERTYAKSEAPPPSNSIITLEELQLWIIEQDNNYRKNNAKELLKIYDRYVLR